MKPSLGRDSPSPCRENQAANSKTRGHSRPGLQTRRQWQSSLGSAAPRGLCLRGFVGVVLSLGPMSLSVNQNLHPAPHHGARTKANTCENSRGSCPEDTVGVHSGQDEGVQPPNLDHRLHLHLALEMGRNTNPLAEASSDFPPGCRCPQGQTSHLACWVRKAFCLFFLLFKQ